MLRLLCPYDRIPVESRKGKLFCPKCKREWRVSKNGYLLIEKEKEKEVKEKENSEKEEEEIKRFLEKQELFEEMKYLLKLIEELQIFRLKYFKGIDWQQTYLELKESIEKRRLYDKALIEKIKKGIEEIMREALKRPKEEKISEIWESSRFNKICPNCRKCELKYDEKKYFCTNCNSFFKIEKQEGKIIYQKIT